MTIRAAKLEDLPQLAQLFEAYRIFYRKKPNLAAAKQFLSKRIQEKDSEIYVAASDEGDLAGFVQLYPLFSSTRMKRVWLLNDLFVQSTFRGKGVSIQLIERAKQLVKDTNAHGMYLETEKSNVIGNRLYPRTGFTLNELANYYEWEA
ncbi:MAG: GNAT family N-acetyltransferase [Bacteroidota bacterium]